MNLKADYKNTVCEYADKFNINHIQRIMPEEFIGKSQWLERTITHISQELLHPKNWSTSLATELARVSAAS